jgi:hypothetical protein
MKIAKKIPVLALFAAALIVGFTGEVMSEDSGRRESGAIERPEVILPIPARNVCPWTYCPTGKPGIGVTVVPPVGRLEFSGFSILPPQGKGGVSWPAKTRCASGSLTSYLEKPLVQPNPPTLMRCHILFRPGLRIRGKSWKPRLISS